MVTNPSPTVAATIKRVSELGILPVVELADSKQAEPLFEALCAGGLPAAELTLRTAAGLPAIGILAKAFPDGLVGAGTVRNREDAAAVINAGAQFVVSPGTDPEVVALCRQNDVLAMPGVCTPTEVQSALRAGAALLKFFPAEAMGGTSFLKALAGPFHEVRFVPTGGINANNLASYLGLPQVAACGGSWMVAPALLAEGNFSQVRDLTAQAVAIVDEARHHA
ncbi:MAG TPA: bifunctional 4-hydroxy-2-oxoglutarate aldolase/2-dehydro-3-deoxy-phosphogluconate aldolase [Acidimicrobiales bacterium]|nr:bifunctional 4-hydroxy-2-oxoglutarate aldolase/2-dehydro-3-deoxy-phosphogluconate aldolase [Acidimicrobiales bacterium]